MYFMSDMTKTMEQQLIAAGWKKTVSQDKGDCNQTVGWFGPSGEMISSYGDASTKGAWCQAFNPAHEAMTCACYRKPMLCV
jgi:hypothetical protein